MKRLSTVAAVAACVLLGACGEKPQTLNRKADAQPWQGAQNPYGAAGWKAGDKTAWEAHLRARSQGQNEYSRSLTK